MEISDSQGGCCITGRRGWGGLRRSNDHNLYAIDAASRALKWKFRPGGRRASSAAVVNGVIYFGNYDGYLYAVDLSGKQRWKFQTNGERQYAGKHLHEPNRPQK